MKNKNIFFLICGLLALLGILFITAGVMLGGRLYGISLGGNGLEVRSQLSNSKASMQTGNESLSEFQDMDVCLEYADIEIIPSDHYGIEYCLDENYKFTYHVENGKLNVEQKSKYRINGNLTFFSLGFSNISDEYVKIYIPENSVLQNASIKNDSGNIDLGNIKCDELTVVDRYGDLNAGTISCKTLDTTLDSGNFKFDELSADSIAVSDKYGNLDADKIYGAKISLDMESGYIKFKDMKADNLTISSSYGDIDIEKQNIKEKLDIKAESGNINFQDITAKAVSVDNSYGNLICDKMDVGLADINLESGDCELGDIKTYNLNVKSDYGNVLLNLVGKCSDYTYDLKTEYGSIEIDGRDMGDTCLDLDSNKENKMVISCDSGNITMKQINE